MKNNLLLILIMLCSFSISRAAVITINYDATQGVSGLSSASQVYMHSGANDIAGALDGSTWKYVVGNWGQADGLGQMTPIGNNHWVISIDPKAYYSQAANGPVTGASIKRIGLVFRNENGSLEGKDANNSDIFIDLAGANPIVRNSNGTLFGGVTVTVNSSVSSSTSSVSRYLVVGHINDTLKVIDSTNFAVVRSMKMTCDSFILGATGLARHPQSGVYYIMLRFHNLDNRYLGTVNPANGAVTIIGSVGDRMSNIVFLPSGKLLGVTGDGALTPESLFSLDIATGTPTFIRTLGAGSGGEAMAYCPDNGKLFHRSGISNQAYEKIDTIAFNLTPIPQVGNPGEETFCMLYTNNGKFISIDRNNDVVTIDTAGVYTYRSSLSQPYKGIEYLACTRNITGALNFCAGSTTTLTATAGAFSYKWYKDGVLIPGQTSTSLNVASP